MKINQFKEVIKELAMSTARIGIKKDMINYFIENGNFEKAKSLQEEILGVKVLNLHGYGERGVGKTAATIEAATEIGFPALYINPAQWVDSADAVGMPKIIEEKGRLRTKNMIKDFFPALAKDEQGKHILREDGGYVVDFKAIKDYIANYNELIVRYNGDINKAPGLIVIWDEFNRIVAQDVQQMMYSVILEHKIDSYQFPSGAFFVALTNPNTGDYGVTGIMEEEAMKDRFIHVFVENDMESFGKYMRKNNFHWAVQDLAYAHPETVKVSGMDYDLRIKPSPRSLEMLSTLLKYTDAEKLEKTVFQELVAGLIGTEMAVRLVNVLEQNGIQKVPTGKEIIEDYPNVQRVVQRVVAHGNRDIIARLCDNFLDEYKEETLKKYDLIPDDEVSIDTNPYARNIYSFLFDLAPEDRVALMKRIMSIKETGSFLTVPFSMYQEIYKLIADSLPKEGEDKEEN